MRIITIDLVKGGDLTCKLGVKHYVSSALTLYRHHNYMLHVVSSGANYGHRLCLPHHLATPLHRYQSRVPVFSPLDQQTDCLIFFGK